MCYREWKDDLLVPLRFSPYSPDIRLRQLRGPLEADIDKLVFRGMTFCYDLALVHFTRLTKVVVCTTHWLKVLVKTKNIKKNC